MNHWIVVIVNKFKKCAYYYDPLERKNDKEVKEVVNLLFPSKRKEYKVSEIDFLIQKDSFNCGVFCIYYIFLYVGNKKISMFTPMKMRLIVSDEIVKFKKYCVDLSNLS